MIKYIFSVSKNTSNFSYCILKDVDFQSGDFFLKQHLSRFITNFLEFL